MFCPVGDQRGCKLEESCIPTLNRTFGFMLQLDPNFENIQSVVKPIIEDIRLTRDSILKMSP